LAYLLSLSSRPAFGGVVLGERGLPGLYFEGVHSASFWFAFPFLWEIHLTLLSADGGPGDFVGCVRYVCHSATHLGASIWGAGTPRSRIWGGYFGLFLGGLRGLHSPFGVSQGDPGLPSRHFQGLLVVVALGDRGVPGPNI
jgi:hypothetical protein